MPPPSRTLELEEAQTIAIGRLSHSGLCRKPAMRCTDDLENVLDVARFAAVLDKDALAPTLLLLLGVRLSALRRHDRTQVSSASVRAPDAAPWGICLEMQMLEGYTRGDCNVVRSLERAAVEADVKSESEQCIQLCSTSIKRVHNAAVRKVGTVCHTQRGEVARSRAVVEEERQCARTSDRELGLEAGTLHALWAELQPIVVEPALTNGDYGPVGGAIGHHG
mmetsp:Transcript_15284/g.39462  ORF Transcript_15284/g.39462 Transcript_15284/m.39462 type:complete len:222 (-) Transcript_15284:186-851(-)